MNKAHRWSQTAWHGHAREARRPFSFTYNGQLSAALLSTWPMERTERRLETGCRETTLLWRDPQSGLQVRCVALAYDDFPIVEWTLFFKNTGGATTPILENIQSLDVTWARNDGGEFLLHHNAGSTMTATDFQPFQTPLEAGQTLRLSPDDGRASGTVMPYFNVAWPGEGAIIAVGWPAQWAAEFARDKQKGLHIRAGQELTHLVLRAGEEIRSPMMTLHFYEGEPTRAHNVWRRWMLAHIVPREQTDMGARPLSPTMFACSSHQFHEMQNANEANQNLFIDRYLAEGLTLDYWWMDAGWYVNGAQAWTNTGTWEVDRARFPNGLRAVTDHARSKKVKSLVWFEPERVAPDTWLAREHPEWLLGGQLLDLGNPDARRWITDRVSSLIESERIDFYRQDFNMAPLPLWRAADAADRQGITENHHVTGYLAYWDELRHRHLHLQIDSCASGGRRLDLESMRRAVPLTRSDYQFEPVGQQNLTYGLAMWLPFFSNGWMDAETADDKINGNAYRLRSCYFPGVIASSDMRRGDLNYPLLRELYKEWREVAPLVLGGDYYPLTPYNSNNDAWMAWQFDRPEQGDGVVQAFRRAENNTDSTPLHLQALEPNATYTVTNADAPGETTGSGRQWMEEGLPVEIKEKPGAAILRYKRRK